MLHIVNGDETLARLQGAGVPGEMLVWGDIIVEGPVPNGLAEPADWEARAAGLERGFGIPRTSYLVRMRACLDRLSRVLPGDEVVLWFDEDLFCQLHLVHILTLLGGRPGVRLSVTPPPEVRSGAVLAAGLAERVPVSPERLTLAGAVWAAYSAPDPRALERLWREGDFSAWPLLHRGVRLHLERFPSTATGLTLIEEEGVRAVLDGPLPFLHIFQTVSGNDRVKAHGLGDLQLAVTLDALSRGEDSLLQIAGQTPGNRSGSFHDWEVSATETARAVLAGEQQWTARGDDRWLGGVALGGPVPAWRWHAAGERLVDGPD